MNRIQGLARTKAGLTSQYIYHVQKRSQSDGSVKSRMSELNVLLKEANDAYYIHAIPSMTDTDYDVYYRELQKLEKEFPNLRHPNSVTMVVGSSLSSDGQKKIRHKTQMTSINSVFEENDVIRFEENCLTSWQAALSYYTPLTSHLFPNARVTQTSLSTMSVSVTPTDLVLLTQISQLYPQILTSLHKLNNVSLPLPKTMLEYKYDGVAMSLVCNIKPKATTVINGATRGDGFYGEDITEKLENTIQVGEHTLSELQHSGLLFSAITDELEKALVKVCKTFSLDISVTDVLHHILRNSGDQKGVELRGEGILCKDMYNALNRKNLAGVNARNTVAGILNRKFDEFDYTREMQVANDQEYKRPVWFLPYALSFSTDANTLLGLKKRIAATLEGITPLSLCLDHIARHNILSQVFSPRLQGYMALSVSTGGGEMWDKCTEKAILRQNLPFETDGVVLKSSDQGQRLSSGVSGKNPRWSIALKFGGAQAWTTISGIELTVGRTGRVTPVAQVDGVTVGGVQVTKASLHNHQWLTERLKLIYEGDEVCIERRGDVIPAVVAARPTEFRNPGARQQLDTLPCKDGQFLCPCAHASILSSLPLLKEGSSRALFCTSDDCESKVIGKQGNFASKSAANISGISAQFITPLVQSGLLDSRPSSFLRLRMSSKYRRALWDLVGRNVYTKDTVDVFRILQESGLSLQHPERYETSPPAVQKHSGFGNQRIASMEKAIVYAFEHLTLASWLSGANIPGLAKASAEKITKILPTATEQYHADKETLLSLKLPNAMKVHLLERLDAELRDEMLILAAYGVPAFQNLLTRTTETPMEPEFTRYQGHNFVFTGSSNYTAEEVIEAMEESMDIQRTMEKQRMHNYLTTEAESKMKKKLHRSFYEGAIVLLGGKCTGDVNKQTTALVQLGEKKLSTKTAKAAKLGITILSEDEFLRTLLQ